MPEHSNASAKHPATPRAHAVTPETERDVPGTDTFPPLNKRQRNSLLAALVAVMLLVGAWLSWQLVSRVPPPQTEQQSTRQ